MAARSLVGRAGSSVRVPGTLCSAYDNRRDRSGIAARCTVGIWVVGRCTVGI